jgi:regulator of sigma E protease
MVQILNIGLTILEFIIAIGFLAFVHELGHYLGARIFNIEIEEFGFGFPPRLLHLFNYQGTDFTLNWIPFGAFVRPKGENDPNIAGGLAAAPPLARLVVLLAGPIMNLAVGAIIFSFLFGSFGIQPETYDVEIAQVSEGSPAEIAGLLPGDIIAEINGQKINNIDELIAIVDANSGQELSITYFRSNILYATSAIPRLNPPEGQKGLGIGMAVANNVPISWNQAPYYGVQATLDYGKQLILLPVMLIQEQISKEEARVSGPIQMFRYYQRVRTIDKEVNAASEQEVPAAMTLSLLAYISISLGFANLLPLPALDGGRIIFVLPELVLRRRIPAQYENMVHVFGFFALIVLMFYITAQDILNPQSLPW